MDTELNPSQLVQILQLTDTFFPVGAFAYSDGLEGAASVGTVPDPESLREWLEQYLDEVFVPCDGLTLLKTVHAFAAGDCDHVCVLDSEVTATRPALSVRNSSRSVGRQLLSTYIAMVKDSNFQKII